MKQIDNYDYSQDFSPEELYEEKEKPEYKTLEEQLSEIGMSINEFL